jgi:hypothetical protein
MGIKQHKIALVIALIARCQPDGFRSVSAGTLAPNRNYVNRGDAVRQRKRQRGCRESLGRNDRDLIGSPRLREFVSEAASDRFSLQR